MPQAVSPFRRPKANTQPCVCGTTAARAYMTGMHCFVGKQMQSGSGTKPKSFSGGPSPGGPSLVEGPRVLLLSHLTPSPTAPAPPLATPSPSPASDCRERRVAPRDLLGQRVVPRNSMGNAYTRPTMFSLGIAVKGARLPCRMGNSWQRTRCLPRTFNGIDKTEGVCGIQQKSVHGKLPDREPT